MSDTQTGLFWTPRGGNNADDIWASCHVFSSVTKQDKTTVIVDMGQNERPNKFANGEFDKVVPALDDCLKVPNSSKPDNKADAILLTHGHSDHIAGIYEYLKIGTELPPIYGTEYTLNLLKKGLIDNGLSTDICEMNAIEAGQTIKIGNMTIDTFPASHSIPGCLSFQLSNEEASIFHSGDTKADEFDFFTEKENPLFSKENPVNIPNVDLMTFDATATDLEGHATYETEVFDAYKEIFEQNKAKQIIAVLPPAHALRIANVIKAANAVGTDVVIDGGASMQSNLFALESSGYNLKEKNPNIEISSKQTDENKNSIVITTGLYQEKNSPFIQKLNGEKSNLVIQDDAIVIAGYSSANNEFLKSLKELVGSKATLITQVEKPQIFGGGHAQADDFLKIASVVNPQFVSPIHCSKQNATDFNNLAEKNGYAILESYPYNGTTVHVKKGQPCKITEQKSPSWIGLNHNTDSNGNESTSFVKVSDNGYSHKLTIEERQKIASKIINKYKGNTNPPLPILKQVNNGR